MATRSVTSSLQAVTPGIADTADSLTSVAMTLAPSRTNISAVARPIPLPAAVTTAIFPTIRLAIVVTHFISSHNSVIHRLFNHENRHQHTRQAHSWRGCPTYDHVLYSGRNRAVSCVAVAPAFSLASWASGL